MEDFIQAQHNNIIQVMVTPLFREVMGALHAAYLRIIDAHNPAAPQTFGRLLLICHKSMLSAATLIAQCQPDDSVGITRRALEAARTALAIKLNPENARQWTAFDARHERWVRRQENERPRPLHVHFQDVAGSPTMQELDTLIGTFSDAYVHFTPEYYSSLDWDVRRREDGNGDVFLNYFHRDPREVERQFLSLAAAHGVILKAFDECFDASFTRTPPISGAIAAFWQTSKRHSDEYNARYGQVAETG